MDNFYLYDDTASGQGIRTAVDGSEGSYWHGNVTSITLGHYYTAGGVCAICGAKQGSGDDYNVKYAVSVWGINHDVDVDGNILGVTFGPATGESYTGVANYKNQYGWWYIKEGKVDFTYNGRASNDYGTWNVAYGKVIF